MAIAHSKLTSQGQISVPAEVRRKLGLGPGSVIEWVEEGGQVVVRHAGRYSSEDIHRALFPDGPPEAVPAEEMKEGIRKLIRKRHARGRY
ncbi:MAG TPA: AbrB/MazE/SpoVT family DNA-binding domain-containing protein [Usitatibacteraceae bacterium]|nr:AbrB/MazE/SpoVT family DNA-binding domain-containing protein [Usitatibacteraceae bacterium]